MLLWRTSAAQHLDLDVAAWSFSVDFISFLFCFLNLFWELPFHCNIKALLYRHQVNRWDDRLTKDHSGGEKTFMKEDGALLGVETNLIIKRKGLSELHPIIQQGYQAMLSDGLQLQAEAHRCGFRHRVWLQKRKRKKKPLALFLLSAARIVLVS